MNTVKLGYMLYSCKTFGDVHVSCNTLGSYIYKHDLSQPAHDSVGTLCMLVSLIISY